MGGVSVKNNGCRLNYQRQHRCDHCIKSHHHPRQTQWCRFTLHYDAALMMLLHWRNDFWFCVKLTGRKAGENKMTRDSHKLCIMNVGLMRLSLVFTSLSPTPALLTRKQEQQSVPELAEIIADIYCIAMAK